MSSLFSPPKAPAPKPVVAMPDPEDAGARAAGAKRVAEVRGAGGRDSTLLSMDQENRRGSAYSAAKLGPT